jgi:succinylarginine dihydrolase
MKMVEFVRAGYPQGVPATDCFPLLAVLRRRLTDGEVAAVATQLVARGDLKIDAAEISSAITRITNEPPSADELDRVQRRLEAIGWPSDPKS